MCTLLYYIFRCCVGCQATMKREKQRWGKRWIGFCRLQRNCIEDFVCIRFWFIHTWNFPLFFLLYLFFHSSAWRCAVSTTNSNSNINKQHITNRMLIFFFFLFFAFWIHWAMLMQAHFLFIYLRIGMRSVIMVTGNRTNRDTPSNALLYVDTWNIPYVKCANEHQTEYVHSVQCTVSCVERCRVVACGL